LWGKRILCKGVNLFIEFCGKERSWNRNYKFILQSNFLNMKNINGILITLICFLSFVQQVHGQKVRTIIRLDSSAGPLDKMDRVFVCINEHELANIPNLKNLGKSVFVGKKSIGYGVDVHARNIEKRARNWGSNFITIDSYITTKRSDSLFATFYVVPKALLESNFANCESKQLVLVNASSKKEKEVEIDDKSLQVPPQSFYRFQVKNEEVSLKTGKGLLTTAGRINFKKLDCRYFKLGGYGLDGAPPGGGIGLGVKSPELTELDRFTAEIYMALFSEF